MGIDVAARARLPRFGIRRRSSGALLRQLEDAFRAEIQDAVLARFLRFERTSDADGLIVALNPLAEPLFLFVPAVGEIESSAKTSSLGPGYHAWVVDLLRRVGDRLKISWLWEDAGDADYPIHADFTALQETMIQLLSALAAGIVDRVGSDLEHCLVNMPLDFEPVVSLPALPEGGALTPAGPLPADWWREAARADPSRLRAMAPEYFVWWGMEMDTLFWSRMSRSLMWMEVPWRIPMRSDELESSLLAVACAERAARLDGVNLLPARELAELRALLRGDDSLRWAPPEAEGVGYRRYLRRWRAPGPWTLEAPGYFVESYEDDSGTLALLFSDRVIRVSTFSAPRGGDDPLGHMLADFVDDASEHAEMIEHADDDVVGRGSIEWVETDEGGTWRLRGAMRTMRSLVLATIEFGSDEHRPWAEDVFRSLRCATKA